jgi:hypothetical protein
MCSRWRHTVGTMGSIPFLIFVIYIIISDPYEAAVILHGSLRFYFSGDQIIVPTTVLSVEDRTLHLSAFFHRLILHSLK